MSYFEDDDEIEFEMIEEEIEEEAEERRRKENVEKVKAAGKAAPAPAETSGLGCLTGIIMMAAVVGLMIIFPG